MVTGEPIGDPLTMVTVSASPSGSVSLLSTLPLTGVFTLVTLISSSVSGGPLSIVLTAPEVALTVVAAPVLLDGLDKVTSKSSCSSMIPSATVARLITSGVIDAPSTGAVYVSTPVVASNATSALAATAVCTAAIQLL